MGIIFPCLTILACLTLSSVLNNNYVFPVSSLAGIAGITLVRVAPRREMWWDFWVVFFNPLFWMYCCYWHCCLFTSVPAAELSLLLREMILKLYSEHLSADGKVIPTFPGIHSTLCLFHCFPPCCCWDWARRVPSLPPQSVDYKGMSANPAFERYAELAIQLQRVELLSLSREEKLAFFINIYNALVIHGYLRLGAPTNMWQRYRVWPGPHSLPHFYYIALYPFMHQHLNRISKSS